MPKQFKDILRAFRFRAGKGLREFAELIGDAPSNYASIESGKRSPWRNMEKLRKVADALGIEEGSADWDAFFVAAQKNLALPPDVAHLAERKMVPVLLRTVDDLRLSEEQLSQLVDYLRKTYGGGK